MQCLVKDFGATTEMPLSSVSSLTNGLSLGNSIFLGRCSSVELFRRLVIVFVDMTFVYSSSSVIYRAFVWHGGAS